MFCIIKKAEKKFFQKQISTKIIGNNNEKIYLISIRNPEKFIGEKKVSKLKNIISDTNNNVIYGTNIKQIANIKEKVLTKYVDILFQDFLKKSLEKEKNGVVLFLDIFAKHQNYCDFLCDYYKNIKVVTQDESSYDKKRETLLDEKGIAISVVRKLPNDLSDFCLIISPDNFIFSSMEKSDKVILIPNEIAKNSKGNIRTFKKPDILEKFIPKEIEDFFDDKEFNFKFQSALFELCGLISQNVENKKQWFCYKKKYVLTLSIKIYIIKIL